MSVPRSRRASVLAALLLAGTASAQEVPRAEPTPTPAPQVPVSGRFRLGPVHLTPAVRLGTLGLDTNVFYTPTDRRADFTASGGPALEVALPVRRSAVLAVRGGLEYLYFARTASLRRLVGDGTADLRWRGGRTEIAAEQTLGRTYGRPSLEVDRRILQDREGTALALRCRLFSRFSLRTRGTRSKLRLPEEEVFKGVELRRRFDQDGWGLEGGLEYALTVKTSLVGLASALERHFTRDPDRDGGFREWKAGVETDETALVSGHLHAGFGEFRPEAAGSETRRYAVADLDATYNHSPLTRLGVRYLRRREYSALAPTENPTLLTQVLGAALEKEIAGTRLDVRAFGRLTWLATDGPITLEDDQGRRLTALREDTAREAGVELGYHFRPRLRVGFTAGYTERRSTIDDFGIEGLLVGATVTYTP